MAFLQGDFIINVRHSQHTTSPQAVTDFNIMRHYSTGLFKPGTCPIIALCINSKAIRCNACGLVLPSARFTLTL